MLNFLRKHWLGRAILCSSLVRFLIVYPLFQLGYLFFRCTGRTPWFFVLMFLLLHEQTRGKFSRWMANAIAKQCPPLDIQAPQGVLGAGPELERELSAAIDALNRDGYHVFQARLSPTVCAELKRFAETQPAKPRVALKDGPRELIFDSENPQASVYDFSEQQLILHSTVQALLGDVSLLCLAQRYLAAAPINDLLAMWWSAPAGQRNLSEAAQLFHFDNDRFRFLKIFFYLTDVGPDNGPHVFVRGSHQDRPDPFYQIRRFSDEEVAARYPAEDIVEITGPVGSIIAVDTSGLHKGKPVEQGARLILQMEFTTSLFGQMYQRPSIPTETDTALEHATERYPPVFRRFRFPHSPGWRETAERP